MILLLRYLTKTGTNYKFTSQVLAELQPGFFSFKNLETFKIKEWTA